MGTKSKVTIEFEETNLDHTNSSKLDLSKSKTLRSTGTFARSRTSFTMSLSAMFSQRRSGSIRSFFLPEEVCSACCGHGQPELCSMRGCRPHESVKTRLSVRNICCDAEVRLIKRIVEPMNGVDSVSVNPFSKICAVVHCPVTCCSSPESILEKLNDAGLGAALIGQGSNDDDLEGIDYVLWCQQHARHFSMFLSTILLIIGGVMSTLEQTEASHALEIAAICVGIPFILAEAAVNLSKCQIDLAFLVIIATVGAVVQNELLDGALVVTLFNLAKVIEHIAMSRVSKALRAVMQLDTIHMVSLAQDGRMVAATELKEGDVISLRPGEECPADGVVTRGSASCSEAAITGEARPVEKRKEHKISSGCVILNGYVEVTLTKDHANSTLSQIEAKVEEAQMQRTGKQLMLERFARIWTPLVLLTVLLVCTVVPWASGQGFHKWIHRGLVILLTACPCAIVIGAPLATTCAIAAAATRGLLIKKPDTVELLPSIRAAGLDKTGTLTKGEFAVLHVEEFKTSIAQAGEMDPLKMAAAVEMKSAHPISAAIVSRAVGCIGDAFESAELPEVKKFCNLPGIGIQGNVSFESSVATVLVGNKRVLDAVHADPTAHARFSTFQAQHPNDTTVAVVVNGILKLGLALNDIIRNDAAAMVSDLKRLGCQPVMLTGDAEDAGKSVAVATGLDPELCHFSMHPEDKLQWVHEQESAGRPALMLGDGINDSTALATATVGAAMGETSAALAANSADVVLMTDKLQRLTQCIRLCRYAICIERLNIFLPCLVKVIEIGFALSGHLQLWMAIVADLGTLMLVLVLGLSVLSRRFWTEKDSQEYSAIESETGSSETESSSQTLQNELSA